MTDEKDEVQTTIEVARNEYDRVLTPEQKAEIERLWDELPDWRKQDIIDEIELGLV